MGRLDRPEAARFGSSGAVQAPRADREGRQQDGGAQVASELRLVVQVCHKSAAAPMLSSPG